MKKLYDFRRLIEKYSVDFLLVTEGEGSYVGGKYVAGEKTVANRRGAIVPLSDKKIYSSGGTLTYKDRQLFMKTPIEESLKYSNVEYKGCNYSIEQETNFDDYADAYIYILKWVSSLSDKHP